MTPTSNRSSRQIAGLVLLLVAAVALLERFTSLPLGLVAPFLLGVGFLVAALLARQVNLLIPAGILLGVGAGLMAERLLTAGWAVDRGAFFLCLGAGFASITLLAQLAFRQRLRWPLIPAAVLAGIGLLHLAGADLRQGARLFQQAWPFVALAAAAWLLLAGRGRRD